MKKIHLAVSTLFITFFLLESCHSSSRKETSVTPVDTTTAQIEFVINNHMVNRRQEDSIWVDLHLIKTAKVGAVKTSVFDSTFKMSAKDFDKEITLRKNVPIDLNKDYLTVVRNFEIRYGTLNFYKHTRSDTWQKTSSVSKVYVDISEFKP